MSGNSVVPCYRGGHECQWPACPSSCDGRPGAKPHEDHDAHVWAWRMWDNAQWQHATALAEFCKP